MEGHKYTRIEHVDTAPQPIDAKSFLPDDVHLHVVKVIIALGLLVNSSQPDLLENLHLVKMGELIKKNNGKGYEQIIGLLQTYYKRYIASSIPPEKSQEYGNLFTRLKYSVRLNNLFSQQNHTEEKAAFDIINESLSVIFSILEKVFSKEDIETILFKSPKPGSSEDKKVNNPATGTNEEERNLIEFYYYPQILREQDEHNVVGYQDQDRMFENLDKAIFEMMKNGRDILAQNLLKHRMLLVAYLLNNKDSMSKIRLVQKLSRATGRVINTFASHPLDAGKINAAVNAYYAECVTSNAALSADSLGKRIIKSVAAIAIGLLFCALLLSMAWLISYFWVGIVLADISCKIQTGIVVTAACSLALSGFFSFKKLRGTSCLDSEINQSTKTITQNMRQIANSPST